MAGGTALAYQFGHRISYDLDFFSQEPADKDEIIAILNTLGKVFVKQNDQGTFNGILDDIKLSFFIYPYALLDKPIKDLGISIASPLDCACMKLDAISSRGLRRDFIDLYVLLQKYSLEELMQAFTKKYAGANTDLFHVLRSLTYFADADTDVSVNLLKPLDWEKVKTFFIHQIQEYTAKRLV